jgi:hydroxyacylglutathione hydrolase
MKISKNLKINDMNLRSFLYCLLMVLFLQSSLYGQVFKNKDLTINKLEANMWVVETSDNTCMYIIEGTRKAILIDTGTNCENLDSIVNLITQKPLYVVITHIHGDHSGNMDQFKDVWFHPADTVLLKRGKPYHGNTHFVKEGDIFKLGGTEIMVKHMPAHTPGSIVLLDKKAGNCYSGDAFGSGQVWLQVKPFSPMKTYIESCMKMEKLMDEGISRIYCGHYPYVKKAYDKSYVSAMRKLAEALYSGTPVDSKPFTVNLGDFGSDNPKIATMGTVSIVYDPEEIK